MTHKSFSSRNSNFDSLCSQITGITQRICVLHTSDGRQRPWVCIGQHHGGFIRLRQVGVAAELLLLGQLQGDRDHTNSAMTISTQPRRFTSLMFPPLLSADLKSPSHPSAVQRTRPFSFLSDEDHAASLLLFLALPHFDLSVAHCHHHLLDCVWTHAAAGTLKDPGCWRLGAKVPNSRKEEDKLVQGVKIATCWPLERIHLWSVQALTWTK